MPELSDPRPMLRDTLDQTRAILTEIEDAQLHLPTPCGDFDVAKVISHMIGGIDFIAAAAASATSGGAAGGGDAGSVKAAPDAASTAEELLAAYDAACETAIYEWEDDPLLHEQLTLPWAKMSGAQFLELYTVEVMVHAWDVAVSVGQEGKLDDEIAEALLPVAHQMIPAEGRGGDGAPFAPVVEVPGTARAADRLAAYTGRRKS